MRVTVRIVGILLILAGALWTLQGSNVLAGSVMSGKSQWLYVGIALFVVGIVAEWWAWRRR